MSIIYTDMYVVTGSSVEKPTSIIETTDPWSMRMRMRMSDIHIKQRLEILLRRLVLDAVSEPNSWFILILNVSWIVSQFPVLFRFSGVTRRKRNLGKKKEWSSQLQWSMVLVLLSYHAMLDWKGSMRWECLLITSLLKLFVPSIPICVCVWVGGGRGVIYCNPRPRTLTHLYSFASTTYVNYSHNVKFVVMIAECDGEWCILCSSQVVSFIISYFITHSRPLSYILTQVTEEFRLTPLFLSCLCKFSVHHSS